MAADAAVQRQSQTAALFPATALLLRLEAPPLPPRKLRAVLPTLLSAELPFPVGDCVVRFGRREADGSVAAHVARRSDLAAELSRLRAAGAEPRRAIPAGPALWRWALQMQPLPQEAARAVLLVPPRGGDAILATGRGSTLLSVSSFATSLGDAGAEAARRLRLAFRGLPQGLSVLVVGGGAAAVVAELPPEIRAIVPDAAETALDRAIAAPGLDDLDFMVGEFADGAAASSAWRPLAAASIAFFAAAALWAFSAQNGFAGAKAEKAAAQAARTAALERLAGRRLATRGTAALAEARDEASARRNPAIFAPDAAAALPDALRAARDAGVCLSHLELDGRDLSASGTAPDAAAAERFRAAAEAAGLRTSLSEPPRRLGEGTKAAFFVHPASVRAAEGAR